MKSYFDTGVEAFLKRDFDLAKQYLNYAKEYGGPREKTAALDLLKEINAGGDVGAIQSDMIQNEISIVGLLSQRCYSKALKVLRKRERSGDASPEDLYYLGLLHDDFGCGMPNNKDKARKYYLNAWNRGFAKAGSAYVCADWNGEQTLTKKQKKILTKAAAAGDSNASCLLTFDRFREQSESAGTEEEIENIREEHLNSLYKILEEDVSCGFAKFLLSQVQLCSPHSKDRASGFDLLQELAEHWNSDIATLATSSIAECYRDGIYVAQDLDEAKKYFRAVLKFKREGGNEAAEEFLSGKWQEVPEENVQSWQMDKLREYLKKVHDVFYLSKRAWIVAESKKEIQEAAENFSAENTYESVCSEISCAAVFFETHLGINDAKSKIEKRIRNELSRVYESLDNWKEVLLEYIPFLNEKIDWVRFGTNAVSDFVLGCVSPIAGVIKTVKNYVDLNNEKNSKNQLIDNLGRKMEKVDARLDKSEEDLCVALAEIFSEFQESATNATIVQKKVSGKCVFCIGCGAKNPARAKFCQECGAKLRK